MQSQVRFFRVPERRFQVTHGNPAEVFPALGFPARFRKAVGDTSEDYFFCLSFFPPTAKLCFAMGSLAQLAPVRSGAASTPGSGKGSRGFWCR